MVATLDSDIVIWRVLIFCFSRHSSWKDDKHLFEIKSQILILYCLLLVSCLEFNLTMHVSKVSLIFDFMCRNYSALWFAPFKTLLSGFSGQKDWIFSVSSPTPYRTDCKLSVRLKVIKIWAWIKSFHAHSFGLVFYL